MSKQEKNQAGYYSFLMHFQNVLIVLSLPTSLFVFVRKVGSHYGSRKNSAINESNSHTLNTT